MRLLPGQRDADRCGRLHEVAISALQPGDRVIVRPGAKVPVDGEIIEGSSAFNEAMPTGESRPVSKTVGAPAIGGAINGANAVTIKVTATGDGLYLSQVIDLAKKAQATRLKTQDLANRAAAWLTYIALVVGFGTLFVWWIVLGSPPGVRSGAHGDGHGRGLPACTRPRRAPGGGRQHIAEREQRSVDPRPGRFRARAQS